MNEQLIAIIEYQRNQLEKAPRGVDPDHEPTARIALFVQRPGVQDMRGCIEDGRVVEAVAPVVLASGRVQLRQRATSTRALRPEWRPSGWQYLLPLRAPSAQRG